MYACMYVCMYACMYVRHPQELFFRMETSCHVCTLKNKIICSSVKSIFSEHEVKNTMFSLKEDFVIAAIDKARNNVAFICQHFYTLTIIKELNLDCHLSNQDDNNTYTFTNNKT